MLLRSRVRSALDPTLFPGCSITRWGNIVSEFYQNNTALGAQVVDDDFIAFVWTHFVHHPGVVIGFQPPGSGDVWIAPQANKRQDEQKRLELLPISDMLSSLSLNDVIETHGKTLRVAATRDIVCEILTGSHVLVRSSSLRRMWNCHLTPQSKKKAFQTQWNGIHCLAISDKKSRQRDAG
jgi:hypothetical protein